MQCARFINSPSPASNFFLCLNIDASSRIPLSCEVLSFLWALMLGLRMARAFYILGQGNLRTILTCKIGYKTIRKRRWSQKFLPSVNEIAVDQQARKHSLYFGVPHQDWPIVHDHYSNDTLLLSTAATSKKTLSASTLCRGNSGKAWRWLNSMVW